MIKRLRSLLINPKRHSKLIKVDVSYFNLSALLKNSPDVDTLLNAKDKQNVPSAVKLIMCIRENTKNPPDKEYNQLQRDIYNEYQLFGIIGYLLCTIFYEIKFSLMSQLVHLAKLSHILLYCYRRNATNFLDDNLYCDIQSTIQDAFVSAAIHHQHSKDEDKLYLYMLGTDQLENLFAAVRTQTHATGCDFLELTQRLKIALQTEKVIIKTHKLAAY